MWWICWILLVVAGACRETVAQILVGSGSTWRYLKGTREASSPVEAWRRPGFDDSAWGGGPAPFRYGDGSGGTLLGDMQNGYPSVFLRREFVVANPVQIGGLRFRIDYDDGFAVWINGREVLEVNAPDIVTYDSLAAASHESGNPETFTIRDAGDLVSGTNVIAVQAFNSSISSGDFLIDLELAGARFVVDTSFSVDRGFYSEPFSVAISSETGSARIRYTTDGSWPSPTRGALYAGPVEIARTTVLRAIAYLEDGSLEPTNVDTQTYFFRDRPIDRRGELQTAYPPEVQAGLRTLPALSLVMDNADFETVRDNGSGGIGSSGGNKQWERPCSVELIYPPELRASLPEIGEGFQVNCGVRPHSWTGTQKRSLKLVFKKKYGPGKLRYPVLETAARHRDSAARQFDKLILRANSNDGWESRWGGSSNAIYIRDQFARDVQIDMGGLGSRGIFVHLFVNGEYWGLYNPVERPDHDFMASYLGGDDSDYFAFNHGGAISGDPSIHDTMHQLARTGDLSVPAEYENFQRYLDVRQFCDYLLANFYCTNPDHDWPVNGSRPQNYYGGNRNSPPGGVQHFTWDSEFSLRRVARVHVNFRPSSSNKEKVFMAAWFALTENDDFMTLFADRAYRHLANDGALTDARSTERLRAWADLIRDAVKTAEAWRWGARGDWEEELQDAFDTIDGNADALLSDLESVGYYPTLAAPLLEHGGVEIRESQLIVLPGFEVRLFNPNAGEGTIYYTTDNSDPRASSGALAASAEDGGDGATVRIDGTAVLRARVKSATEWSAMREVVFYEPQDFGKLRVTEVMYHPPDVGATEGDEYEFIELKNVGPVALDLSGVHFSDGIAYRFPFGSPLAPGAFIVLVSNEEAFRARYVGVPLDGIYEKNLSNSGETIELNGFSGERIAAFTYGDRSPWPEAADGGGYSLVPASAVPVGDADDPESWRRSSAIGGSPGADDGASFAGAPFIERQPRSAAVFEGERAVFTVLATGNPLPDYQWQRDGEDIPGETAWIHATAPVALGDDGARFRCIVSNTLASVETAEAILRVDAPPLFEETVAMPAFSPDGGKVEEGTLIRLSTATRDAQIRYTLDGSSPSTSSILYTAPFTLPFGFSRELLARGFRPDFNPSPVASAEFTVIPDTTPPSIESVLTPDENTVRLTFSEPVEEQSAEMTTNYTITGEWGDVRVFSAELAGEPRTRATLSTARLAEGIEYTLTVVGVADLARVPNVADDSVVFRFSSDLEAHWRFDEGAGFDALDSSGKRHDGRLVNGPGWIAETPDGSSHALWFDGEDSYVDVGTVDVVGNALTICAWFQAADFGVADGRLVSKATGTADQDHTWMLSTISSGGAIRLRFRLRTSGNTTTFIAPSGDLGPGVWTHAAAVYDGSAMRLYVNGRQVGSAPKSGPLDLNPSVAAAIGNQPAGSGAKPFHGAIDDVRIYSRGLSGAEITDLATPPPPGGSFIRGDANADNSSDIADAITVLLYLFSGLETLPCEKAADMDDDGQLSVTDAIFFLRYLFQGAGSLRAPWAACGLDQTMDDLTCESYPPCSRR